MPSSRPSSRVQRSSFQGLSIIEGKRSLPAVSKKVTNDLNLYKQRNERRRRSSSLAQSTQIQKIIEATVKELKGSDGRNSESSKQHLTAEDRLKEVLKKAKEGGHSADRIFSLLGKLDEGKLDEDVAPKHLFVEGLVRLGFRGDEQELETIANRFDLNRDGLISLVEFRHFCCHEIQGHAWKAERQRLENTPNAHGNSTADAGAVNETRFDVKDIMYAIGPEVFKTSKLFWRQGVSVNVSLKYCSNIDIITMQIKDSESKDDYKTLFVKKSDCAVDQEALKEAATLAVQTSDEASDESKALIMKNVHWEFYANYLVTRLQIANDDEGSCYTPSLAKLHGDKYVTLEIEKPSNLTAPKIITERIPMGGMDEFDKKVKSFQRDSRQARTSRQSAQELSSVVEAALNEILTEGV